MLAPLRSIIEQNRLVNVELHAVPWWSASQEDAIGHIEKQKSDGGRETQWVDTETAVDPSGIMSWTDKTNTTP
jgi:hypothetical protein